MKTLLLLLCTFAAQPSFAQATFPHSADGLRWLFNGANDSYLFRPPFAPTGNASTYKAGYLARPNPDGLCSPNLKYTVVGTPGTKRNTRGIPVPNNTYDVYTWPMGPVTPGRYAEPVKYTNQYYPLAILDDGTLLTTDPTFDKKTTTYDNLYLANPATKQVQPLFQGRVWEKAVNDFRRQPEATVSADNGLIAVRDHQRFLIVDVAARKTVTAVLPAEVENRLYGDVYQFFFAADNSLLCVAGVSRGKDYQAPNPQMFVMAFDAKTGSQVSTLLLPANGHGNGTLSFYNLKSQTYMFDSHRLELTPLRFSAAGSPPLAPVKIDTAGLKLLPIASYHRLLMAAPQGPLFAMVPQSPVRFHKSAMVVFEAATGRRHSELAIHPNQFYQDPTPAERAEAAARAAKYAAAEEVRKAQYCAEMQKTAQAYVGLSYTGDNSKPHYVLGYDCQKGGYEVAYLEKVSNVGPPGNTVYLPHYVLKPTVLPLEVIQRRKPVQSGLVVCSACNGDPVGSRSTTSTGWTKRYVLGAVYYIQDDVTNHSTTYTRCGACKGAALVPR